MSAPALKRRGFPSPARNRTTPLGACDTPRISVTYERNTPVPTCAHQSPRAIRVRRSPR
ncbi:hypothetical protein Save01_05159 [Streptomyces avermitilis]|nr:hypothetical protein SAVCW2_43640 [Streptomyces avermitilis]